MGISRRKCADLLGVSEAAIRKALKVGRISAEPDGTLDPEKAKAAWAKSTDPARAKPRTGSQGAQPEPEPAVAAQAAVEAQLATTRLREILRAEGIEVTGPLDFNLARTAEKIVQTWQRDQLHAQGQGRLVDADDVTRRWADRVAMFRARMLAVPGDLALDLPHLTKHDVSVIDRVMRDALQAMFDEIAAGSS